MHAMRIGFDASPSHDHASRGLARVVRETLAALERTSEPGLEVVRLLPASDRDFTHARWRRELGALVRSQRLDGLHSFTSAFAWRAGVPSVQTIHELPWRHGERENAGLAHKLWARGGPLFAARIATATEHTARDVRAAAPWSARRVRVIPWGVGPPFAPESPPGAVDEPVLRKYRLGEDPIALCLGGARAKKRCADFLRGVRAWRATHKRRLQIVVTGSDGPALRSLLGLASQLGLAGEVAWVERIDELDLAPLLRLSSVVPLLSRSEGFGLPVLEALACGTPVLVPPSTAQAEVAGDAAIHCDPGEPESVAAALARALDEREALRFTLPERAAQFPWSRSADGIRALWRELRNERGAERAR
ncbi:MAG: glycosyltransferase family 1 protein [Planctomycetota bacterium]|nr:MAG: glycosyltransferase family 1 protein [Planctomycetota bacterium]